MVGWNVATTYLVAEQLILKISIIYVFNFCNCICFMNYYEHTECLNKYVFLPLFISCIMQLYMFLIQCIFIIMFMGLDFSFDSRNNSVG